MLRSIASTAFSVIVMTCLTNPSSAQDAGKPGAAPPPSSPVQEHMAKLSGMCPPVSRMPEAEASKLPVDVTRWGTTGPKVLIVHGGVQGGLGGGPSNFAGQKVLGDQGWQLEVVDRPGFGKSPSRGVDDMNADSIWIADMLGSGANLMGHSWGGAEALLAAARRPQAVKSLIMIEPAFRVLLASDSNLASKAGAKTDAERFAGLIMSANTPGEYGITFARNLGASSTGDKTNEVVTYLEKDPKIADHEGCALLQAHMAPYAEMKQAAETVAKADIPVLIITGGWNPSYDAAGDTLAKLTGGKHVIVRSPNHFVQASSPDAFNKVVVDFMHEADAKSAQPAAAGR